MNSRTLRVSLAVVLVFSLACPAPAWAFGRKGHQIVARIAESRLTPAARAAIDELLGEGHRISDEDVANWADEIRNFVPESGPWHYVDIPVTESGYNRKRDCKYSDCVIERIERFREVLANKKAKPNERQRALKFLVHFVGDMHQPLHCAERTDSTGKPDRGGNDCKVRFLNESAETNLHKVWDTQLVEHALGEMDPLAYADQLNVKIDDATAAGWLKGTTRAWANQSFRAAKDHVYAGVAADGPATRLDEDYVNKNRKVLDEQFMKAGIRLAEVLNEALK
jgi:hypothetical protein